VEARPGHRSWLVSSAASCDAPEVSEPLERDTVIEQRRQRPLREPALKRDVTGVVGDSGRWEVVLQPRIAGRDGEELVQLNVRERAVLILRDSAALEDRATDPVVTLEQRGEEGEPGRADLDRAVAGHVDSGRSTLSRLARAHLGDRKDSRSARSSL